MLQTAVQRRAVRRAVQTGCQVVATNEFALLAQRVVDLSPRGMLVACDRHARLGDEVIVSFKVPGRGELWLDAEAVVARIVQGQRRGDLGYCAGLDFSYFERSARHELLVRLAGYPPPIPKRSLRTARERAALRSARESTPAPRSARELTTSCPHPRQAVRVCPIVMLDDGPVIPLTRIKRSAPRGVFA